MAKFSYQILSVVEPVDRVRGVRWDAAGWQPRVDICGNSEALWIQVEAPGLDEANLLLHFEPGQLLIEGHRLRPELPSDARCLQMEIEYGHFKRRVPLPPEADGEGIRAQYQAGILLVVVPLRPSPSSVRIAIS